jgi:hypothetical protein
MDINEIKLHVIHQIIQIDDLDLIKTIQHLLERTDSLISIERTDFWNEFSMEQQLQIEHSIQQLKDGKGISHLKVMTDFRRRYTT